MLGDTGDEKGEGRWKYKRHEEIFAINGYVCYLYYNGGFTEVHIYQDMSNFTL